MKKENQTLENSDKRSNSDAKDLWAVVHRLVRFIVKREDNEIIDKPDFRFVQKILIAKVEHDRACDKQIMKGVAVFFAEKLSQIYQEYDFKGDFSDRRTEKIQKWLARAEKEFGPLTEVQKKAFHKPATNSVADRKKKKITAELNGKQSYLISGSTRNAYDRMKYCFPDARKSTLYAFKKQHLKQLEALGAFKSKGEFAQKDFHDQNLSRIKKEISSIQKQEIRWLLDHIRPLNNPKARRVSGSETRKIFREITENSLESFYF